MTKIYTRKLTSEKRRNRKGKGKGKKKWILMGYWDIEKKKITLDF